MIIDFHHHLLGGLDYADTLVREMDKIGTDITCLIGLGIGRNLPKDTRFSTNSLGSMAADNDDVLAAMKRHPQRLLGLAVVNLDKDGPDSIRRYKDQGFSALKVFCPRKDYDHDAYMPIYEQAEAEDMAILFHTGMVLPMPTDKENDVSSERMRPMKLDRVARNFPELKMVLAHLGYPFYDEAAAMLRFHENVYVDFSASSYGWRNRLAPADFRRYLFWEDAFDRVVYGTDVVVTDISNAYREQKLLCRLLNLTKENQEKIFGGNAASLLHLGE